MNADRAVTNALRAHGALIYLFLYIPIFIVILFAFNDTNRRSAQWVGFSVRWFEVALNDQVVHRALLSPPFNLILHSAPFLDGLRDVYHWHVELMPKLTKVAGFEWATGFYLNPTAPEEAAQVLRSAKGSR